MNNQVKSLRLSDAIALGQHLITWSNERTLSNGRGCACGMALAALGEDSGHAEVFYKHYPWGKELSLHREITHKFERVMDGKLTLDELIDWIREIEPEETCEQSKSFAETEQFSLTKTTPIELEDISGLPISITAKSATR